VLVSDREVLPHQSTRHGRGPWIEPYPTALCRDDLCPWKYVGVDLEVTQRKAEAHVADSGHAVRVYRQLHRDIEPVSDG
jgi:hypothetical protein